MKRRTETVVKETRRDQYRFMIIDSPLSSKRIQRRSQERNHNWFYSFRVTSPSLSCWRPRAPTLNILNEYRQTGTTQELHDFHLCLINIKEYVNTLLSTLCVLHSNTFVFCSRWRPAAQTTRSESTASVWIIYNCCRKTLLPVLTPACCMLVWHTYKERSGDCTV